MTNAPSHSKNKSQVIEASVEGLITMQSLMALRDTLAKKIAAHPTKHEITLILDTDQHEFESATLLGVMRQMLGEFAGEDKPISRIAFVTLAQFVRPAENGGKVAFFEEIEHARLWAKQ
ncbi:hypothetical protein [Maritalea myrionectae]|uniref:hypothetical protein n=1 Tax=Maritalea myrionectae TaxID=454601 RepID=UPI000409E6A9|nr:hypothetical protein [Maritalea myrionectae]